MKNKINYKLYLIGEEESIDIKKLELFFDEELSNVNFLFKTRRDTNLLSIIKAKHISIIEFVELINLDKKSCWESQFKFLPLYTVRRKKKSLTSFYFTIVQ